jgi:parallel beta-helix repeat protein
MLALLMANVFSFTFIVQPAKAETIIVPVHYTTIQAAVNAAALGDTILVLNGTYYEGLHINKSLNLVGENPAATIIDGHVVINANNVQFRGFTVRSGTGGYYGTGLLIDASDGCTVTHNIITRCIHEYGFGVMMQGSNNNTIGENLITQNDGIGIELFYDSNYNRIVNNTISYNHGGIGISDWAGRCVENVIMDNDIQSTGSACVSVASCGEKTKIIGNRMTNSPYGIVFYRCSRHTEPVLCNTTLADNWIAKCGYGIRVDADFNNITENTVMNCTYGISVCGASTNNTVYHNNFISNVQQVNMTGANTVWDDGYPSGGNYWSDYNGTDSDGDGIGDTPYIIDEYNQDDYPLMYPRPFMMGDINCDCQVDIYDVTAVCIAYDSQSGDPNWYPPADIAEPYGIIDIYDVTAVCISYGKKWPH